MTLSEELKLLLRSKGAIVAGFANIADISHESLPIGVAIGINLPPKIAIKLSRGPDLDIYYATLEIEHKLDEIIQAGEEFIQSMGFKAYAQPAKQPLDDWYGVMPHEEIAVRAGLGWIGKSGNLITERFGACVILCSMLTDMPLDCSGHLNSSKCGTCQLCSSVCPAHAIFGKDWSFGTEKHELRDIPACRQLARKAGNARLEIDYEMCERCRGVCPETEKYFYYY